MTLVDDIRVWTTACEYDHLIPGRGVGVLLDDATQVALFRLDDGTLRAMGNVDPFSGASVCRAASSATVVAARWCSRRSRSRPSPSMTGRVSTIPRYRCRSIRPAFQIDGVVQVAR